MKGLRSATIVETVVALLILMIITSLSLTLFVEIMSADMLMDQIRAKAIIQEDVTKMQNGEIPIDQNESAGEYQLQKEVIPLSQPQCWLVTFFVYGPTHKWILSEKQIIKKTSATE